jgi:hypothetical protein
MSAAEGGSRDPRNFGIAMPAGMHGEAKGRSFRAFAVAVPILPNKMFALSDARMLSELR